VPGTINVITPEGQTTAIPLEQLAQAINAGYSIETQGAGLSRAADEGKLANYDGIGATVEAAVQGGLRGATFGLSDVIQRGLGDEQDVEDLRLLERAHPTASTIGEIGGAIAPALLSGGGGIGGSLARATPAGAAARLGTRIAEAGAERGALAKIGLLGASGAAEGAAQGAGAYVSDVALDNKPLSAEGFLGAMGSGAFWGGGAGLALGVTERALTSARKLFPSQQITRQAADDAERAATGELDSALADGEEMVTAARDEVRRRRLSASPEVQAELDRIRVESAQALATQRLETARALDARRIENAGKPRKPRKALAKAAEEPAQELAGGAAAPSPAPATAADKAAPASDDLLGQLTATKAGIDEGKSLGELSGEARADAVIAKADPEAGKIIAAERQLRMSKDEVRAWVDRYKKTDPTEKNVTSKAHRSRGGNERIVSFPELPPDELRAIRAAEEARVAARETLADRVVSGRVKPGKVVGPDGAPVTADDVIAASEFQRPGSVDAALASALREKMDLADLGEAAEIIGRYEHASAEMVDALGAAAPPAATRRAADYRAAIGAQEDRLGAVAVEAGEDAARAASIPEAQAASRGRGGFLSAAGDVGAAVEALGMLGVPGMPDLRNIPVIGPLLGLYMAARAKSAIFRKLGMKVPATAETVIAGKAAATRQRVAKAIDAMLSTGARGAQLAIERKAPTTAAVLATRLFDESEPTGRRSKPKEDGDLSAAYHARLDELVAAARPGAVRDAVRARVRTSDPALVAAIVAATQAKLDYLAQHAPKSPIAPTAIAGGRSDWAPSKAVLASFARRIEAADDPAGVLERMAHGGDMSMEAAETIKAVYPELYAEAQQSLIDRVHDAKAKPLPYARRVQLSILFDVPLDGTMEPSYIAAMQEGYAAPDPAAPPPATAAPPTPGLAADINPGRSFATDFDRRAGGM
jgi:hypothetical protein